MSNKWEVFFDKCIKEIAKENIVLDIGSGNHFQKGMKKYKSVFEHCKYYSLDFAIQYKPYIVGDILNLPFRDESADAIICNAVLEHVPEPQKAIKEMYRVLREGGKIFVYVPFLFPYHGGGIYRDYYRFTKDGAKYMFQNSKKVEMVPVRGYFGTINLFLPFTSKNFRLANFLDKVKVKSKGISMRRTSGYNIFAIK